MAKNEPQGKPTGAMENLTAAKVAHKLVCDKPDQFTRPRKMRGVGRHHASTCLGCGTTVFGSRGE